MILKVFTMLFNYIFFICFLEATFYMVLKMLSEILLKIPSCVISHWSMFSFANLLLNAIKMRHIFCFSQGAFGVIFQDHGRLSGSKSPL
jgi:hypothetical protein